MCRPRLTRAYVGWTAATKLGADEYAINVDLPLDPEHWEIAIPLFDDDELLGIVFYGAHIDGRAMEDDEREALESLTDRAANALAILRLVALREENALLRRGIRVAMDGTKPAALPAI